MFGFRWLANKEDRWRAFEAEAMPLMADLYRSAMWLTRDRTEAEDLVQETMFQALRSFHRYQEGTNCKAWLMTIMFNHNSKRLAKVSRTGLVVDTEDMIAETIAFEPPIPQSITDEDVVEALSRVPRSFRDVVVLADVEGFSYKEIALIVNVPVGTVMSRLHRGRKLLRLELAYYARNFRFGENRRTAGN